MYWNLCVMFEHLYKHPWSTDHGQTCERHLNTAIAVHPRMWAVWETAAVVPLLRKSCTKCAPTLVQSSKVVNMCAAYQWGAALTFKFNATFLCFSSPLRDANMHSSLRKWFVTAFSSFFVSNPPRLLNIIRIFNQGTLSAEQTGKAVRCKLVPVHLQRPKILTKLRHHMRTIKMTLWGVLSCRCHILENMTERKKVSACCVPISQKFLSQKAQRLVQSVVLFFYWRRHTEEEHRRGRSLHLEVC